jgi:hypothetical protein
MVDALIFSDDIVPENRLPVEILSEEILLNDER